MEVTVQGDVVQELANVCNELYDVVDVVFSNLQIPLECMYVVDGKTRKKLFQFVYGLFVTNMFDHLLMYLCILRTSSGAVMDFQK